MDFLIVFLCTIVSPYFIMKFLCRRLVAVEVDSLPNHVNFFGLCVYLLFNFHLFTVINLSLRVLFAQQVVAE